MKSNYERKNFIKLFFLVTGIILVTSFALLLYLGMSLSRSYLPVLILIGVTEIVMVVIIFLLTKLYIDKAYRSLDGASDIMVSMLEDSKNNSGKVLSDEELEASESMQKIREYKATELQEGSVGIFYDNFEKLIHMFQESRRKEKSEKEYLQDVMSDISHQLKTPLASMDVFLDLIVNDKVSSEDERKMILGEASNQVNRMEWMVLSMLKLARIEAGAITFDIGDVNVAAMLSEVAGGVKYLLDTRGQSLMIDCPEDITVKADGQWLTEAVINIVKNASDYSAKNEESLSQASENQELRKSTDKKESGRIEIKVEQNAIFTRICISDNGIGMSEETMTHIFERFYRASNEVNPNSVGIGLSLSKSIVEGMGGRITVESTLGEGSTFKLQF